MTGFILLHRQLIENKLWFSEPFTRAQAWIDILLITNYQQSTLFIRGNEITIERGQFAYAQETLAQRWKWSRDKVRTFLDWLEQEGQISQQKNHILSIYTVLNYEQYQQFPTTETQQKNDRPYNGKTYKTNGNKSKQIKKRQSVDSISPYDTLTKVTEEVIRELAEKYHTTTEYVKDKKEALRIYCESKGKSYKNYKAALENFIRRDSKNPQETDHTNDNQGETLEEVRAKAEQNMAELDQLATEQGL